MTKHNEGRYLEIEYYPAVGELDRPNFHYG
jgi:hypothetical protein